MKTIKEVKNEVAKENNFCDWLELLKMCTADMIDEYCDKVIERYSDQYKFRLVGVMGGSSRTIALSSAIIDSLDNHHLMLNKEAVKKMSETNIFKGVEIKNIKVSEAINMKIPVDLIIKTHDRYYTNETNLERTSQANEATR